MADFINATTASKIASKDTNRLVGSVAKSLAVNSPYINAINGGVFAAGISDTVKSVIQLPAAPGDAKAIPDFTALTSICGTSGAQDKTDVVPLTYTLEGRRGVGPLVCVKDGFAAFKTSYSAAEDALKKQVVQYINADIRGQLILRSATKFQAKKATAFESLILGGTEANVNQAWDNTIDVDGTITFATVHKIARFMREQLLAEMYPGSGQSQPHFKFVGSADIIQAFREETGVKEILIALTNGSYKIGADALTGYNWETSPAYRGIAFASDQRPVRASAVAGDNTLTTIDPVTVVANGGTNTAYSKTNSSWTSGALEVGVLMAYGAFERQTPEKYVGEGSFKFAPQLHMGELEWHYQLDNDKNMHGDYGWHKYQIERAYRPLRPQWIVPILYKRASTASTGIV